MIDALVLAVFMWPALTPTQSDHSPAIEASSASLDVEPMPGDRRSRKGIGEGDGVLFEPDMDGLLAEVERMRIEALRRDATCCRFVPEDCGLACEEMTTMDCEFVTEQQPSPLLYLCLVDERETPSISPGHRLERSIGCFVMLMLIACALSEIRHGRK